MAQAAARQTGEIAPELQAVIASRPTGLSSLKKIIREPALSQDAG
jgi:hypothetical protein